MDICFPQDPEVRMACAPCYRAAVRVQRDSITGVIRWLTELAAYRDGLPAPEIPSQMRVCRAEPACEESKCEAPVCRQLSAMNASTHHIKRLVRECHESAPPVNAALYQLVITWAGLKTAVHRTTQIRLSPISYHAALLANNTLALFDKAHPPSPGCLTDDFRVNSKPSEDTLRIILAGNSHDIEAGDLICIHQLRRTVEGVLKGAEQLLPEPPTPPRSAFDHYLLRLAKSPEWKERCALLDFLKECDLLTMAPSLFEPPPSSDPVFPSDPDGISQILRQVLATEGGNLMLTRIARHMGEVVWAQFAGAESSDNGIGTNGRVVRFAQICRSLLDNDPDFHGTHIVSHLLLEVVRRFPTNLLKRPTNGESHVMGVTGDPNESNPLWQMMSNERSTDEMGMPAVLAMFMSRVSDLRHTRRSWSDNDATTILRFDTLASVLLTRPVLGSPYWQLMMVRFLRSVLKQPKQARRIPVGCGMDLTSLCKQVERIHHAYQKHNGVVTGALITALTTEMAHLINQSDFIRTSLSLQLDEAKPRKLPGLAKAGRGGPLDNYLGTLIANKSVYGTDILPVWRAGTIKPPPPGSPHGAGSPPPTGPPAPSGGGVTYGGSSWTESGNSDYSGNPASPPPPTQKPAPSSSPAKGRAAHRRKK